MLLYLRNEISFFEVPEGRYSRFDHVPTACSYPNAPQKMIFYFLYLYSY